MLMLRIFKIKAFNCWTIKTQLHDKILQQAATEIALGQYEASLGGYLYKKRIALGNKGKSGGARVILAFKREDRAIFIYGFSKNQKANITIEEAAALKTLAKTYFMYTEEEIERLLKIKEFIEVDNYE